MAMLIKCLLQILCITTNKNMTNNVRGKVTMAANNKGHKPVCGQWDIMSTWLP